MRMQQPTITEFGLLPGGKIADLIRSMAITATTPNEAVALSELYGEFMTQNLFDRFSDIEFQGLIEKKLRNFATPKKLNGNIHYITDALETGGHTPLFINIVKAQAHLGLSPQIVTRKKSWALKFAVNEEIPVHVIEDWQEIISLDISGSLYISANPSDIAACILADHAKENGASVFFVNHADHGFFFQPKLATSFLEISGLGRSISNLHRSVQSSHFLGICTGTEKNKNSWAPSHERFLLTIARKDKLRPIDGFNFPAFADKVTKAFGIKFVIFGQNGTEEWWQPYKNNRKIELMGAMPFEKIIPYIQKSYGYIDSFPLTGGSVLPAVASVGVPIFSLKGSAFGYNAVEEIRLDTEKEVFDRLDDYISKQHLFYDLSELSESVSKWHSVFSFYNRVEKIINGEVASVPSWARRQNISIQDVRKELFRDLRFNGELSSDIGIINRGRILGAFWNHRKQLCEKNWRSEVVSVLGKGSFSHTMLSKLKNGLKEEKLD